MKKNFLSIDPLNLDVAWLRQANLYYKHSELLAEARRKSDNAKSLLDVVWAEVARKVRMRPAKYGIKDERVTEAAIEAAIELSKEYREASQAVIDANYEVNVHQSAVTALEHKKRALTMLVELHLSGYYAEPRVKNRNHRDQLQDSAQRMAGKKTRLNTLKREDKEND
jgi:hypothetical protein